MDGCEEIAGEFVVSCGYAPEILESAEASFDDVAPLVGALVERVQYYAVGFVGNDGFDAALGDECPEGVAVITFVGEESAHRRRQRQDIWRGGDVGVLAWRQMDCVGPTERIAQRVDFRGASTA